MVVVMAAEAEEADVQAVVTLVETAGGEAFVSRGVNRTIVGLVGDVEQFGTLNLRGHARREPTSYGSPPRTSWSAGRTTRTARSYGWAACRSGRTR